jgi:hypothetical protein
MATIVSGALVEVREYVRFRLGHWEVVRSHVRNWPCRKQGQIPNE